MNSCFNSGSAMKCFEQVLSELSTPLAYKAQCLLKNTGLKAVLELKVNPVKYTCPQALLQDLQLTSFFKKFEDLPFSTSAEKKEKAMNLFWESERACFVTNRRLTPLLDDPYHYGERMSLFIKAWRKNVSRILGRAPSWGQIEGRFGNGATFDNVGSQTSVADKLTDNYTTTKIPSDLLQTWEETAWARNAAQGRLPLQFFSDERDTDHAVRSLTFIRGSRFTTVPKDWNKDRGICIEPSLNVHYQLGIGRFLAKRLKWHGIDKYEGQVIHKNLARIASLTKACATIDLSNASDTVSEVLIKLLLPDDWWQLVAAVRCTHTLVNGKWVMLEKFSSMGNGYTFELETLVFYTLCLTVSQMDGVKEDPFTPGLAISVYGDDIIVPTSIAACVLSSLRFFGFTPNEAKTFTKGSFRESCGGDYLSGFDVRPFYLKKDLDENHRHIAAANGLRRTRIRGEAAGLKPGFLLKPWRQLLKALPRHVRDCLGPVALGDLVIQDEHWVKHARVKVRNSIRYVRVWRPVMHRAIPVTHFRPGVIYAAKLYGDTQMSGLDTDFRGKPLNPFVPKIKGTYVSGYKLGWVPYS